MQSKIVKYRFHIQTKIDEKDSYMTLLKYSNFDEELKKKIIRIVNGTFRGEKADVFVEMEAQKGITFLTELKELIKKHRVSDEEFPEINTLIEELGICFFDEGLQNSIKGIIDGTFDGNKVEIFDKIGKLASLSNNSATSEEVDDEARKIQEGRSSDLTDLIKKNAVVFFGLAKLSLKTANKDKKRTGLVTVRDTVIETHRRTNQIVGKAVVKGVNATEANVSRLSSKADSLFKAVSTSEQAASKSLSNVLMEKHARLVSSFRSASLNKADKKTARDEHKEDVSDADSPETVALSWEVGNDEASMTPRKEETSAFRDFHEAKQENTFVQAKQGAMRIDSSELLSVPSIQEIADPNLVIQSVETSAETAPEKTRFRSKSFSTIESDLAAAQRAERVQDKKQVVSVDDSSFVKQQDVLRVESNKDSFVHLAQEMRVPEISSAATYSVIQTEQKVPISNDSIDSEKAGAASSDQEPAATALAEHRSRSNSLVTISSVPEASSVKANHNILFDKLAENNDLKIEVSDLKRLVMQEYYKERTKIAGWRFFCQNGSKTISQLQALLTGLEDNAKVTLAQIKQAIHRTEKKFNNGTGNGTNFILNKIKEHFDAEQLRQQPQTESRKNSLN